MSINHEVGVLTLGYGPDRYINMAIRLAQSLMLNSPSYPRAIVTDRYDDELSKYFDFVVPYNPEYGRNLEQKLHLDLYSPFQRTMFIDADCLVVRNLDFAFNIFRGHGLTTTQSGKKSYGYTDPNFETNVDRVLDYFNIDSISKFNGGVYYFERGSICTTVFEKAREILKFYPELGINEFRNCGPNEEILMSISMEINDVKSIQDDGAIMRTPIGSDGRIEIDVLRNHSRFIKKGKTVSPAIVHYCGRWILHPTYVREAFRLENAVDGKSHSWLPTSIMLFLVYLRAKLRYSLFRFVQNFRKKYVRAKLRLRGVETSAREYRFP